MMSAPTSINAHTDIIKGTPPPSYMVHISFNSLLN